MAKSGSLDFVARDKRLDSRQSNSGNGRLFSATIGPVQGDAHGSGGAGDARKGNKGGGCGRHGAAKVGILRLWDSVGGAGKDLWVFSVPETAFSIDVAPWVQLKLITYFHGSRALRQPDTERSPKNII